MHSHLCVIRLGGFCTTKSDMYRMKVPQKKKDRIYASLLPFAYDGGFSHCALRIRMLRSSTSIHVTYAVFSYAYNMNCSIQMKETMFY